MKIIYTKYLGPTYYRGSRIKAYDFHKNSVTIPYRHNLNPKEAHSEAAKALCAKLRINGNITFGDTVKRGYIFIVAD